MSNKTTLGGERLGSGGKAEVSTRHFERSNHNLNRTFKTTMSPGTLVPFSRRLGLPGDKFDVKLKAFVMTHPTIGPALDSFKLQLDMFKIDMALYMPDILLNTKGLGFELGEVYIPQIRLEASKTDQLEEDLDNCQINPSCLLAYLGKRGVGTIPDTSAYEDVYRDFNALTELMYYDIGGQYYVNKQEEKGYVIHNNLLSTIYTTVEATWYGQAGSGFEEVALTESNSPIDEGNLNWEVPGGGIVDNRVVLTFTGLTEFAPESVQLWVREDVVGEWKLIRAIDLFYDVEKVGQVVTCWHPKENDHISSQTIGIGAYVIRQEEIFTDLKPRLQEYEISAIDRMRRTIVRHEGGPFVLRNQDALEFPYKGLLWKRANPDGKMLYSKKSAQEGLLVKTYQSDRFNNWLRTDWIEGENGINELTRIDTSAGSFTLDEFYTQQRVYQMLNYVAVSDGSYQSARQIMWDHRTTSRVDNAVYVGGMSQEIAFSEVISTAATEGEPLATLAGKGRSHGDQSGGRVTVTFDDPGYMMGIVSITPRIVYSQGNKWDNNLKTFGDLHTPFMDGVGFQDLPTDEMAWWDTTIGQNGQNEVIMYSAGKQPAWTQYTTEVDESYGNFARVNDQMFMTNNRRYTPKATALGYNIKDLTTYIDPSKFNYMFADTRLSGMNFWVQIKEEVFARRKMSASLMPVM